MATISNENVSVGDKLYDIAIGYGTVISLGTHQLTLMFNDGRRIQYSPNGYYGETRRLYWHNPRVIDPPRDESKWLTLTECVEALAKSYLK